MKAYTKKISRCIDQNQNYTHEQKPGTNKQQSKKAWIEHYADQMLRSFSAWGTCLGVSRQYLVLLKQELSELYEQPLRKSFIETTYRISAA